MFGKCKEGEWEMEGGEEERGVEEGREGPYHNVTGVLHFSRENCPLVPEETAGSLAIRRKQFAARTPE